VVDTSKGAGRSHGFGPGRGRVSSTASSKERNAAGLEKTATGFVVTVDVVCLTIRNDKLQVLLVRRHGGPYRGRLALPGGVVGIEEGLEDAARRELSEDTGIDLTGLVIEQLATYGGPDRDPRRRTVSVAWLAVAPDLPEAEPGTDAAEARWWPVAEVEDRPRRLAFDHGRILADGLSRARGKIEYNALATAFCKPEFTVAELRRVYEVIWGGELDPGNFHRKVTGAAGFIIPTGDQVRRAGGRPAQLYRAGRAATLQPPLLRTTFG
jgi:8-oxo-dGTP diphosphatase